VKITEAKWIRPSRFSFTVASVGAIWKARKAIPFIQFIVGSDGFGCAIAVRIISSKKAGFSCSTIS